MLKKLNKKGIALLIASAVLLTAIIGTTIAYLIDVTETVEDTFIPANVVCSVSESGGLYTVTNEGNIPVYIRVAVIVNATDSTDPSKLTWDSNFSYLIAPNADKWQLYEGYYYYKGKLAVRDFVDLIQYTKSGTQIQILAEAIQATPDEAAKTAWGVTYDSETQTWS